METDPYSLLILAGIDVTFSPVTGGILVALLIVVVLLIGILVSGYFERDVLGITKYQWVLLVTLVYLILVVIARLRKLNYFYYNDEGDKILIRYYPIHPLVQKKRAIKIPKIGLSGYEFKKSMMGLKKTIVLRQKVKGKVATYPPIGITALSRKEVDLLKTNLDKYVRP